jgi:hypothetical protein
MSGNENAHMGLKRAKSSHTLRNARDRVQAIEQATDARADSASGTKRDFPIHFYRPPEGHRRFRSTNIAVNTIAPMPDMIAEMTSRGLAVLMTSSRSVQKWNQNISAGTPKNHL